MKNDLTAEQLQQPVTITLPLSALLRLNEPGDIAAMSVTIDARPAIGEASQGTLYAGLTIHENAPHRLYLLAAKPAKALSWSDAKAWAEQQGGVLPSRIDQLVLFKNLKREFDDAWYWSGEEYAGDADGAWLQLFGDGNQGGTRKSYKYRARAVRRVPL